MNTEIKTSTQITLKLTPEEAHWIKALVQNAQGPFSKEEVEDTKMRMILFNALPGFTELDELIHQQS